MSILLLSNGTDALLLANGTDRLELVLGGTTTHFAEVSFSATASLSPTLKTVQFLEVAFAAAVTLAAELSIVIANAEVVFLARAKLTPTIRPQGKKRRTIVVDRDGVPYGELENARHGAIVFELNRWTEASFALGLADPKSGLVLEERIREAQLWRGDQLLAFGPMIRPGADKTNLGVEVRGPSWYLTRRHVGKAGRDNRLKNPSFEDGLRSWSVLKGAYFLTYEHLNGSEATIFEPGKDSGRALALRADRKPWVTPPSIVGASSSTHTVVSGDTLWALATGFYGSGTEWWRIYNANAALIEAGARAAGLWNPRDPGHWIFPGQVLTIPGVVANEAKTSVPESTYEWGDVFAFQDVPVTAGDRPIVATLTGWAYVRSDEFDEYAPEERGLLLQRFPTNYRTSSSLGTSWGGYRGLYTEAIETSQSTIDDEHAFDQWVRHEVSITIPAGKTEILHARVCSVDGLVLWDGLALTFDDALEFYNADQRTILEGIVDHAQDPTFDKTDLNLAVSGNLTGIRRDFFALHSEHANIWDLVEGFTEGSEGVDLEEFVTPTERSLIVHYPARGSLKSVPLELGVNVADFAWAFDGEAASSAVIVLGTGDGSDREEAASIDPEAFAGGLSLEEVFSVPPETPIEHLDKLAAERLAVSSSPEVLAVKTVSHSEEAHRNLIGRIAPGDVVPVRIRRGGLSIADDYRIVRLAVNPDDTLDLILNRRGIPT